MFTVTVRALRTIAVELIAALVMSAGIAGVTALVTVTAA